MFVFGVVEKEFVLKTGLFVFGVVEKEFVLKSGAECEAGAGAGGQDENQVHEAGVEGKQTGRK